MNPYDLGELLMYKHGDQWNFCISLSVTPFSYSNDTTYIYKVLLLNGNIETINDSKHWIMKVK